MFGKKKEQQPGGAKAFDGVLSKDLPDKRVSVPEELKSKSYYKYVQIPVEPVPQDLKDEIFSRNFKVGEGLEVKDRAKLQEEDPYPVLDGVYPLKGGGVLTCANVKTPDLTGEMLGWWASWHGIDPLRYAIWDSEDHYDLQIIGNKERLLDESIPAGERVIGTKHSILESFDCDEPTNLTMEFISPWDVGYDRSLDGTDRHMYMVCANASMGGKIPVFASEVLVKGKDGQNECRCRFWIGYQLQDDGRIVYKLPKFIRPPKKVVQQLIIHNHKEFTHLNRVLPELYREYHDKPFEVD